MAARKLTPSVVLRAQQLRSSGWTLEAIARELGVSLGSARTACTAPALERIDCAIPVGDPPLPSPPEDPPPLDPTDPSLRAALSTPLETLTQIARTLAAALVGPIDTNTQLSIARLSKDVSIAIAKLTPAPPPKHDEHPDMIAAAATFRTRLQESLGREAARREAAPKCVECGAPILQVGEESPVQQLIRWCLDG